MQDDVVVNRLNKALHGLDYHFHQNDLEACLTLHDFPTVFFSLDAGGDVQGGSQCWIEQKHADGSIHEPGTIAAFLFVQAYFSNRIKTIFDIGALYGYFGLIGKSLFPGATTFSFEMNPVSYAALERNACANKHLGIPAVRCINAGLSDRTVLQTKVSIDQFKLVEKSRFSDATKLDLFSVDDFCRFCNVAPDLIKIDVEGYQAKIIPGGMKTIKETRPIILLEFDGAEGLKPFRTSNKEIVKPLFDLGYRLFWCGNQRGNGHFQALDYDTLSDQHERNSLGVFLPS